ncbi:MAG: outer membrane protein transport protein [Candidatus Cloacimonetes bacterium]|nr:outer membrane protein transport protein [Candidatus Cloacimonadota bacterium]
MQRNFVLILILVSLVSLFSEGLKVISFQKDSYDLKGSVEPLSDANGDLCSILRIEHNLSNEVYLTDVEVYKRVKKTNSIVYFYLSRHESSVTISVENYLPIKYRFEDTLESEKTYVLKLTGSLSIPIIIKTNLSGVKVSIDGKLMGRTEDKQISFAIADGMHEVKLAAAGFETIDDTINVSMKNQMFEYELNEKMNSTVYINTIPSQAEIYINEIKFGISPVTDFFPEGVYSIRIEKESYETINDTIAITEFTEKEYILKDIRATLTVRTYPGATVFINNDPGYKGGVTGLKLNPQIVHIRVEMKNAKSIDDTIILEKQQNVEKEYYPEVETGIVMINVIPRNAKIELWSENDDYYNSFGKRVFKDIPVGKYRLKVSEDSYESFNSTFYVERDSTYKDEIQLSPQTKTVNKPKTVNSTESKYTNIKRQTSNNLQHFTLFNKLKNPAALASIDKSSISTNLHCFSYKGEYEMPGGGKYENADLVFFDYYFKYSQRNRNGKLNWSISMKTEYPYGRPSSWDIYQQPDTMNELYLGGDINGNGTLDDLPLVWDGEIEENETSCSMRVIDFHPSFGYKFSDKLSAGIGLSLDLALLELSKIKLHSTVGPYLPIFYHMDGIGMIFGADYGLIYKPTECLSIGLSGRTESEFKLNVKADIDVYVNNMIAMSMGLSDAFTDHSNPDAEATIVLPADLRVGLGYSINKHWLVSADLTYTWWEAVDAITLEFEDGATLMGQPIPDEVIILNWENTMRFGLGTEYVKGPWAYRFGYYYDESPLNDETMTVIFSDFSTKNALNAGFGYVVTNNLWLDFAVEYIMFEERAVDEYEDNMPGTYNGGIMDIMLDFTWKF